MKGEKLKGGGIDRQTGGRLSTRDVIKANPLIVARDCGDCAGSLGNASTCFGTPD